MLEIRPVCECCAVPLPADSPEARICTFECTFCRDCVDGPLGGVCPNCGGDFQPRPIRPARLLEKHPPSTERIVKKGGCDSAPFLHRYAAFTTVPEGGNPAGVWIGETFPEADAMQRIAAAVGFSETAFVAPANGFERTVRYFSPEAEVPFCGHATIAAGVVLGVTHGAGTYALETTAGRILVDVEEESGPWSASLTSVEPRHEAASDALVAEALATLRWDRADLDDAIPPARAYAGAWHLVLAVSTRERLADLDYDFGALKALMLRDGLTTLQLVWRESATVFHARNPFPIGGVVEDPATGAAAAALGGYLRDARLLAAPATLTVHQGEALGRPSVLEVGVPEHGGIVVTGTAVAL